MIIPAFGCHQKNEIVILTIAMHSAIVRCEVLAIAR